MPIALAAGQSRTSVDATMLAGGRLSGTVDPLPVTEGDSPVSPRAAVYRQTAQGWAFVGVNDVADNGAFRQLGLVSGTYAVVAYTTEGDHVPEAYDNAAVPGFNGSAPETYSPPAWVHTLAVTQGEDTVVPDEIVLQRTDALDHAAPVSSSDAPSGWVNHDVVVHLSAADAAGAPFALYGAVGEATLAPTSVLPTITAEGATPIRFLAEDAHGNREATRSATVHIDRTPPVTIDDHKAVYGSQAFIRMYGTDNLSGADELRYQLDGGAAVLGAAVVTTETGVHTLAYRSTDHAGNVEETRTVTFQVGGATVDESDDVTAPQSFAEAPSGWVQP
ncbi:MAG: hypothetical protein Q7V62_00095, partial [Actinomycetota bacterium]|nr:hypothetical protein [Actinomycetota bacterium]